MVGTCYTNDVRFGFHISAALSTLFVLKQDFTAQFYRSDNDGPTNSKRASKIEHRMQTDVTFSWIHCVSSRESFTRTKFTRVVGTVLYLYSCRGVISSRSCMLMTCARVHFVLLSLPLPPSSLSRSLSYATCSNAGAQRYSWFVVGKVKDRIVMVRYACQRLNWRLQSARYYFLFFESVSRVPC